MGWKEFAKDYLNFTRRERIAVLFIAGLMVLTILAPKIVALTSVKKPVTADTSWFAEVRKLEINAEDSFTRSKDNGENEDYAYQYDRTKTNYSNSENIKGELFYFDPNKITGKEWTRLGLREKTIQIIQNYLSKGGKFRKPQDLQRIYGLRQNEFERLEPYIRIEIVEENKVNELINPYPKENKEPRTFTTRYSIIDINTADTTAFISLPGIGSKLAARIVNFRDKLGGFYTVEQVKETFGLPDSTYQKIKQWMRLDNPSVKKININTATVDELKAHPYIKYSLANPIVAYRNEHGPFSKVEDVKIVMAVKEDDYRKISPYLTVQ